MTNEERLATLETGMKNVYHQLDELKRQTADIHDLTSSVKVIAAKMENVSTKVDSMDERLQEIEKEPAKAFAHYKQLIIGCIITGTVGAILGAILALVLK